MHHVGDERARFWLKVRLGLVAAFFVIGFLAALGRVYYLQTVEAEALEDRTSVQRDREVTRQARRGDIRDRNGVELAVSVEVPSISARPNMIADPQREARRLAEVLDRSEERLLELLDSDRHFVWLQRKAHPDTAEAALALEIPGLETTTEYQRYYPMAEIAGQLLGFVGIDGEGLEGLERRFNDELAGGTYNLRVSRDARGRPMLLSETPEFSEFEGNSLYLTIDEKIQQTAERALRAQIEEFNAKRGTAVVMDVETGDVLAMANTPTFDPNRLDDYSSADWRLGAVTDIFEPGSVFKPFLVAAALQEEAVTLDTEYDLEGGTLQIGSHWVRDIIRRDEMTVAEVIQNSSNVGSYRIAQDLGRENYYNYIRAFGFGSPTGISLHGERSGMVWPSDRWAEITFANVAFGQGLSTTPIQLAAAVASLGNGGRLLEPRIVDEVRDGDGNTVWHGDTTMVRQVISPEVSEQMAWAMSLVTLEAGTGTAGALEHYTVAAKTGTAQKVNPETRAYDPDLWVSGFVGFVPAENPEFAIVVFIDEPQGMRYGGAVAGPAFAEIAAEALSRRGVLPLPAEERFQHGDDEHEELIAELRPSPLEEEALPPTIAAVEPRAPQPVADGEVPDFVTMTMRQALDAARNVDLVPQISGWGRVTGQHPAPGTPIDEVAELTLSLSPDTDRELLPDEPSLGGMTEEN